MIGSKTILGIIPARAGSKGLIDKNIRYLMGKPLIAWSIEAGLLSKYIDELVVSTDSSEIAKIAEENGATVPFIRPLDLASDDASTIAVIEHTLNYFRTVLDKQFDYCVLLEPTSPLRDVVDIDKAIEQLIDTPTAKSLVGISKSGVQNPAFQVRINSESFLLINPALDSEVKRRQDVEDSYFFEGSVYISETQALLEKKSFYHERTIGKIFPKWKSFEVDDIDDLIIIEALMKHRMVADGL